MKKILMAIATALVAGNLFAFSITGGLVYAYSDVRTLDTSSLAPSLKKESETTNLIGGQIGFYNGLLGPIGFFADVQALFPMSSVQKSDSGYSFKPTNTFDINLLLGPALAFNINDVTRIKIGAGLDLGFNTGNYQDDQNATLRTHTFKYGVGAKIDADFMLLGFLGINVGCDIGAIWGTESITVELGKVAESHKSNYVNDGKSKTFNLLVLPSISAVFKLGN